jgi:7-cyano-7-deazaguanine synthase
METIIGNVTVMRETSALVMFSGGQDSTTCLAWALTRFDSVQTVGFRYGQRHVVEMEVRDSTRRELRLMSSDWDKRLADDYIVDLPLLSALGKGRVQVESARPVRSESSFESGRRYIPGRNLLFVSMSSIVAFHKNVRHLVCGVSETEYSGYPDCRDTSVKLMQAAVSSSMNYDVIVHTPLMWLNKAGVWRLARELGGDKLVSLIVEHTHTCYIGVRSTRHDWGFGCGDCDACKLRSKGWIEFASGQSF